MRVLLDYASNPAWQRELSALTDRGLDVDFCGYRQRAKVS
jgi:hypothetical protein